MTNGSAIPPEPDSIARREPTPEQEAEIISVVDEERKAYAVERHR
jgi:hypothetical protein